MAFAQAYAEYLQTQPPVFPCLSFDRLDSLLLQCKASSSGSDRVSGCTACDDTFFSLLAKEVTTVYKYFNTRVRWLLRIHLASGVTKCIYRIKHKQARDFLAMIQEGQNLVKCVSMTTLATRQLLEKYDKRLYMFEHEHKSLMLTVRTSYVCEKCRQVHLSAEGSKFRTRLLAMHVDIVQSPWLVELLALYFNLKLTKARSILPEMCSGCICDMQSGKPTLSCTLHESIKLEVDVTCSICLEIVFEPVALKCGHIFCFKCACAAASVSVVNGFKKAKKNARCPLCREMGVFAGAMQLRELNILINRSCKDYCKKRYQRERKEQRKLLKQMEYWSYTPAGSATYTMF